MPDNSYPDHHLAANFGWSLINNGSYNVMINEPGDKGRHVSYTMGTVTS